MIRQVIACIAVFLFTVYFFFLYGDEVLSMLLVIEVIYFVAALLWLRYLKGKIEVSMDHVIPLAEKNQEIPIDIRIRNRTRLPFVHVKICMQMENSFTGEKKKFSSIVTVGGQEIANARFVLKAKNCGNVAIILHAWCVYDILGILKWKQKGKNVQYVAIFPECHLLSVEVTKKTREFIVDGDEYSDKESGNDPSEVYQVREYREKDSMRDIHWKLSAKANELLVKEHGRPIGCSVLIWFNLQTDGKVGKYIPTVLLETVASLSFSLIEAECAHMIAWYDVHSGKIQKKAVKKEENVYELLHHLLYMKSYQESTAVLYENAFRGVPFSTIVEIQSNGTILINQEEKMKVPLQEEQVLWEQLYFIV